MASLVLNVLIVLGMGGLSVRLYSTGLSHRYRGFFYYLVFETIQTGVMLPMDQRSGLYQKFYVLTEPINWIFYAWVVLELYSLVLKDYQGLYTVGSRALMVAVALALLGSAIIVMVPSHGATQGSRVLPYYYLAQRAIYFSLVVFLLTILGFLLQFPVTLSRNITLHSVVYTVYFLCNTVIYLMLGTVGFKLISVLSYALLAATLGSLVAWLAMLNPAGEERRMRLRPTWMPGREEELIGQLNSLNEALLRATRK
jgi:hypothetical protein